MNCTIIVLYEKPLKLRLKILRASLYIIRAFYGIQDRTGTGNQFIDRINIISEKYRGR